MNGAGLLTLLTAAALSPLGAAAKTEAQAGPESMLMADDAGVRAVQGRWSCSYSAAPYSASTAVGVAKMVSGRITESKVTARRRPATAR